MTTRKKIYFDLIPVHWQPKKSCDVWHLLVERKLFKRYNFNGVRVTQRQVLKMIIRRKNEVFADILGSDVLAENVDFYFNFKKLDLDV